MVLVAHVGHVMAQRTDATALLIMVQHGGAPMILHIKAPGFSPDSFGTRTEQKHTVQAKGPSDS
eukprot:CAMPEP_0171907722 /NCGR_PEP_ID=MMETSP0993-20121228/7209_1 /TAXON_ID=483369 /ORGANISM="non described non described, Strain CCMP2098" /LENGTH=63 /DNA_ID=CAMNT_0012540043 /DNA_START=35 /DNA_END=223 /DNA_ORIENTATION=-